ncbi:hypothetical protein FB00_11235 [Cellulosimicrobium funkei]|uniref:DUF3168 domain-containing protein n=1 Tax=Cellulosimicrobium funkei TaxID=264251 RepID=A0A0H2KN58_9MICO|nr:hypothetical protein [Cellulosimicrobium funkei]KLN34573.1 hypothetical protein FB00_11235 [Cellulosimicrobium funkei]
MSARTEVVAFLRENTDLKVEDYAPANAAAITAPTVYVTQNSIEWGLTVGLFQVGLTLSLVVPYEDYKRAEDALDDTVFDLLAALDGLPSITGTATRSVFGDKVHGYEISLTLPLKKETE